MRPSPPDAPTTRLPEDDHVVVEAATAEQAIAEVHDRLGADAQILQAEKVLRGGLWGFFPKQVVQLTARPAGTADAAEVRRAPSVEERLAAARPAATAPEAASEPVPHGLEAVLARLSAQEDDEEEGLGTVLRRQLGVHIEEDTPDMADQRAPVPAMAAAGTPTPGPAWSVPAADPGDRRVRPVTGGEPVQDVPVGLDAALRTLHPRDHEGLPLEDVEYARGDGTPWSGRGLLMLGLPRGFVEAVLAQDPADDAAWTYAVARTLAPLCRPLPAGPAAVVGPRAERLSRALGLPLVRLSSAPRGRSAFAAACTDSARSRTWLATHRGSRWTHLVVGGSDWRGLLFEGPLAVSWVGDDALADAIRTAHELGMVLGPGVRCGDLVDPAPIELAMLLRDLLGGRA